MSAYTSKEKRVLLLQNQASVLSDASQETLDDFYLSAQGNNSTYHGLLPVSSLVTATVESPKLVMVLKKSIETLVYNGGQIPKPLKTTYNIDDNHLNFGYEYKRRYTVGNQTPEGLVVIANWLNRLQDQLENSLSKALNTAQLQRQTPWVHISSVDQVYTMIFDQLMAMAPEALTMICYAIPYNLLQSISLGYYPVMHADHSTHVTSYYGTLEIQFNGSTNRLNTYNYSRENTNRLVNALVRTSVMDIVKLIDHMSLPNFNNPIVSYALSQKKIKTPTWDIYVIPNKNNMNFRKKLCSTTGNEETAIYLCNLLGNLMLLNKYVSDGVEKNFTCDLEPKLKTFLLNMPTRSNLLEEFKEFLDAKDIRLSSGGAQGATTDDPSNVGGERLLGGSESPGSGTPGDASGNVCCGESNCGLPARLADALAPAVH